MSKICFFLGVLIGEILFELMKRDAFRIFLIMLWYLKNVKNKNDFSSYLYYLNVIVFVFKRRTYKNLWNLILLRIKLVGEVKIIFQLNIFMT